MSEWFSVKARMPENAKHLGAFCPKLRLYTKRGETEGWYNPDKKCWYVLFWFLTGRYDETDIDFYRGDIPTVVKVPGDSNFVTHWMPMPKPPKVNKAEEVNHE